MMALLCVVKAWVIDKVKNCIKKHKTCYNLKGTNLIKMRIRN